MSDILSAEGALAALLTRCMVAEPGKIHLDDYPTDSRVTGLDKTSGKDALRREVEAIAALQQRLFAAKRWAMLMILQSMDAGGKDSSIRRIFSGIDPEGVRVTSFKAPSREELGQDFLRRTQQGLPVRGEISVFNRSYYEEVLITRLHPEMLAAQQLPKPELTDQIWRHRLEDIAGHERYLGRQGMPVLKFFLHMSKEEQRQRFLRRLNRPDKIWKFDAADISERKLWDKYAHAYGEVFSATAAPHAPWFIIPADHKWVARLLMAHALRRALEKLDPHFPKPQAEALKAAEAAKASLEAEG
ncbi:polyphosphate kinase 2 family protein [Acidisoma cellulosilytica]|uniref:Polyphosphate kinase 2 family protein n=1 Tax=Acidisoma cellulosilyticum TaxID=2802395 RepID=A0A964E2Z3_9PROT|nr:PPK2 family polyphosphate kinase [Acidisoma cellulosilyticum]MCB8879824.1 polyphosphate kinase 2 family protein [Acidisoma cellulosilyticum]